MTTPSANPAHSTAAIVLGAGSSRRLGQPKQLLEYQGRPLLQAAVDLANAGPFEHVLVTVGGAGEAVREAIDFGRATPVESVAYTTGCSSSIVAALEEITGDSRGFVLLLGDQPHVSQETISALIADTSASPIGVCRYDNGIGHPFWFGQEVFADLELLHGDKAVWKLIESGEYPVAETRRPGDVPLDVDTWEDYELLLSTS